MLQITNAIVIAEDEIELSAIRAQGPGGQNVNKVSSTIHLRFDIRGSSLPEFYKAELLKLSDSRITKEGVIVIKAQTHRTQEKNRVEALSRLQQLVKSVGIFKKKRKPTKPSRSAKIKRVDSKTKRGKTKALRSKVSKHLRD
ncbi:UNVERIFIED_CONTAM: hypothetical protein GTU68_064691 [Idotea baltica]|nr:hypothetical protein [Idotea baltica]